VSSTEALIALENEMCVMATLLLAPPCFSSIVRVTNNSDVCSIADSTGNIIRSDEDVASVDVWLMTCIANDFYFSVQGQTAADLFINFFVYV